VGFRGGSEAVDGARREHLRDAARADSQYPQAGPSSLRAGRGAPEEHVGLIGDGGNRSQEAHVTNVVRLCRLAFENAEPGAIYHAVDQEGVSMKAIAEAMGRG